MKEQLIKIQEHYHGSSAQVMSFLTVTQPPSQVDLDLALKQWHFCAKLARHMYDVSWLFGSAMNFVVDKHIKDSKFVFSQDVIFFFLNNRRLRQVLAKLFGK